MLVQVAVISETLNLLLHQVAIRHRVADGRNLQAHSLQNGGNPTGGLALAGTGPYSTDTNNWFRGFHLGRFCTHQTKIRSQGINQG